MAEDNLTDNSSPLLETTRVIGFSSVTGFCVGAAFKRVGTEAAYLLGSAFITLNALAYAGYVEVNWLKMRSDFESKLDVDGDQKITSKDFKLWLQKLLPYGVNAAGFAVGLVAALKYL
jgi:uncharacterized membrane protein (Fun14 family)